MLEAIAAAELTELATTYRSACETVYGISDCRVGTDIPPDALQKTISAYANYDPKWETPCLLIRDDTVFMEEGLLLTNEHLFYRRNDRGAVALRRVRTIEIDKSGILVVNGEKIAKIGDKHSFGLFLSAAVVERLRLKANDLVGDILHARALTLDPDEEFKEREGFDLALTSKRVIAHTSSFTARFSEITDIKLTPTPASYTRPNQNHPLLTVAVMLARSSSRG